MNLRPLMITENGDNPKADFCIDFPEIGLGITTAFALVVGVFVSFWILLV